LLIITIKLTLIVDGKSKEKPVGVPHQGEAQNAITQREHRCKGAALPNKLQIPVRPYLPKHDQ
jgi:hypothetical protein